MGRKFATFYRFILMTTSVSAVVLSIISATSCAFVSFDHQYKTSATAAEGGRRMLKEWKKRVVNGSWNLRRRMQDPFLTQPGVQLTQTTPFPTEEESYSSTYTTPYPEQIIPGGDLMNEEYPDYEDEIAQSNAEAIKQALAYDGVTNPNYDENGYPITTSSTEASYVGGAAAAFVNNEPTTPTSNGPNGLGGDAMAQTVAAPSDTAETYPTNGPNSVGGDTMAQTVAAPADSTETFPTNGPNSVAGDAMAGTVAEPSDNFGTSPSNGPNSVGGDPMAGAVPAAQDEDTGDVDFGPGSKGDSMAGEYSGESSTPQVSGGGGPYGNSSYDSTAASATGASAIVKGDAGLFCDTDPSFTYTSLWNGGSIKAFEAEIASESDNNKSEEVARNAGIIAIVVGVLMATILTIEFLLGRKMCLEKWFVGLFALVAIGSQGATFAFFNSQRYCDGDILHEILNQEPCVMGKGGFMSIGALLLYFLTLLLVCKVPEDDPYGICCKGDKANYSEKVFQGDTDNSDLLMESNNDGKPERPGWISEDKRSEEEENEII